MKCQIMFPGKNEKNISECCLLKILLRVLSFNMLNGQQLFNPYSAVHDNPYLCKECSKEAI